MCPKHSPGFRPHLFLTVWNGRHVFRFASYVGKDWKKRWRIVSLRDWVEIGFWNIKSAQSVANKGSHTPNKPTFESRLKETTNRYLSWMVHVCLNFHSHIIVLLIEKEVRVEESRNHLSVFRSRCQHRFENKTKQVLVECDFHKFGTDT